MNKFLVVLLSFSLAYTALINCMEIPNQNIEIISDQSALIREIFEQMKAQEKEDSSRIKDKLKQVIQDETEIDTKWFLKGLELFTYKQLVETYDKASKMCEYSDKEFAQILLRCFYEKLLALISKKEIEDIVDCPEENTLKNLFPELKSVTNKSTSDEENEYADSNSLSVVTQPSSSTSDKENDSLNVGHNFQDIIPAEMFFAILFMAIDDLYKELMDGLIDLDDMNYKSFRKVIGFINNFTCVSRECRNTKESLVKYLKYLVSEYVLLLKAYRNMAIWNREDSPELLFQKNGKGSLLYIMTCLDKINGNEFCICSEKYEPMNALMLIIDNLLLQDLYEREVGLFVTLIDKLLAQGADPDDAFVYLLNETKYCRNQNEVNLVKKIIAIFNRYLNDKFKISIVGSYSGIFSGYLSNLWFKHDTSDTK